MALRTQRRQSLVAAGRRVNFADRREIDRLRQSRPRWQAEAWDYYDSIGSVRWSMDLVARLATRCQVRLGWYPQPHDPAILPDLVPLVLDENGRPEVDDEGELIAPDAWPDPAIIALADELLDRVINGLGGPHELMSLGTIHLNVPGETWIIGRRVENPDGSIREVWSIHSGDTIEVQGDTVRVRLGEGSGPTNTVELNTAVGPNGEVGAFAARIWNRHPRFQDQPTSTMRAVLEDCEELNIIRRRVRAAHRSHISAGILVVADELDGPGGNASTGDEVEGDGTEEGDVAEDIAQALIVPVNEDGSDAAVAPIILTAPHELVQNAIKHTTLGRPIDATVLAERDQLTKAIANGLPLPPEAVTGVGDVNHWTAWQVAEDTFRVGAAPPIETLLRGMSTFVLQELIVAAGMPRDMAERVCVWYDPADAIAKPDPIAVIAAAFGDGVIDATAYRRYLPGVTEDDAPSIDELVVRQLQARGVFTAEMTAQLIAILGGPKLVATAPAPAGLPAGDEDVVDVEPIEDGGEGPPPEGEPETTAAALLAAAGAARADLITARLGELERTLFASLLATANAAVERAMERVGNRARNLARRSNAVTAAGAPVRALADQVDAGQLPRTLGRGLTAALGTGDEDEVRAELAAMHATFVRLVGDAARQTIELIAVLADDPGTVAAVLSFTARFDAQVQTAATFFVDLLVGDTMRELFDDVDIDPARLGELDRSLRVQPETLRRALAVAGGGDPADAVPQAGGLTGGPLSTEAAAEAGMVRIGYDWVYGAGVRGAPFPPHRALDGRFFADYESPVLSTAGTGHEWVGSFFHPGDHAGCQCDAQPVFRPRPDPDAQG